MHQGTHEPEFQVIQRNVKQKSGGQAMAGIPGSVTFPLVAGKKEYENGPETLAVHTKLTLLASGKLPKKPRMKELGSDRGLTPV